MIAIIVVVRAVTPRPVDVLLGLIPMRLRPPKELEELTPDRTAAPTWAPRCMASAAQPAVRERIGSPSV
jgi:hypothetical protein